MVIVAAAAIGGAYTAYWFFLAANIEDGIGEWAAARAGTGLRVSQKRIEISGYPLALRVIVTAPRIALSRLSASGEGDNWEWRGQKLTARIAPWNLGRILLDLSGAHEMVIAAGHRRQNYRWQAGRLILVASLHGDKLPASIAVSAGALTLKTARDVRLVAIKSADIIAERLFPGEATAQTPTFSLELRLQGVELPAGFHLPLGQVVHGLKLEAKVFGTFDLPLTLEAIGRWRDAGGMVEVDRLEAQYGPLDLRAGGTLYLDEVMQPVGKITAKVRGFFDVLSALRRAGHIRSSDAARLRLILGVLATKPKNGGTPTISLPLSIQGRKIYAGPVPLMGMPVIKWGRQPATSGSQNLP